MEIDNKELFRNIRGLLAEGHTVTLRVKGNSMRPFLINGKDKVVIKPIHALSRGDMVLAEITPNQFVLHRLVKIEGKAITLMGDGNILLKEHCTLSDVIGLVAFVIRNGKTIDVRKWRFYAYLWMKFRPIRRFLLALHSRIIKNRDY